MGVKVNPRFKSKRFLYVIVVPIVIFAIAFILTLLERVLIYMVIGFFAAWAVHFYSKRNYSQKGTKKEVPTG